MDMSHGGFWDDPANPIRHYIKYESCSSSNESPSGGNISHQPLLHRTATSASAQLRAHMAPLSYASATSSQATLNFATNEEDMVEYFRRNSNASSGTGVVSRSASLINSSVNNGRVSRQDPLSHRIIEKRRRDRMNNCLADLSRLIPTEYLKKGRGRVEKTEIIEMAIRHMKHLQHLNHYRLGYQECMSEMMRFMVEVEGYFSRDPLCIRLLTHLQAHCDSLCMHPATASGSVATTVASPPHPPLSSTPGLPSNTVTTPPGGSSMSVDHHHHHHLHGGGGNTHSMTVGVVDASYRGGDHDRLLLDPLKREPNNNSGSNHSDGGNTANMTEEDGGTDDEGGGGCIVLDGGMSIDGPVTAASSSVRSTDTTHAEDKHIDGGHYKYKNDIKLRFCQDLSTSSSSAAAVVGTSGLGIMHSGNAATTEGTSGRPTTAAPPKMSPLSGGRRCSDGSCIENHSSSPSSPHGRRSSGCGELDLRSSCERDPCTSHHHQQQLMMVVASPAESSMSKSTTSSSRHHHIGIMTASAGGLLRHLKSPPLTTNASSMPLAGGVPLKTDVKPPDTGGGTGSCLVPIFALHAKGAYYVPLTVEYQALLPFMHGHDLAAAMDDDLSVCGAAANVVLHPVTINVNFQPHQGGYV